MSLKSFSIPRSVYLRLDTTYIYSEWMDLFPQIVGDSAVKDPRMLLYENADRLPNLSPIFYTPGNAQKNVSDGLSYDVICGVVRMDGRRLSIRSRRLKEGDGRQTLAEELWAFFPRLHEISNLYHVSDEAMRSGLYGTVSKIFFCAKPSISSTIKIVNLVSPNGNVR